MNLQILVTSLEAGAVLWFGSALLVALPMALELVLPRWNDGARTVELLLPCLVVVLCSTLPGGTAVGAAAAFRARTSRVPAAAPIELGA